MLLLPISIPHSAFHIPHLLWPPPPPPIFLDEIVSRLRPPGSCFVVRKSRPSLLPAFENRHDDFPAALGHIAARVERRIAEDAIKQQAFVSFRRRDAERCAIAEIHVHPPNARRLSRNLRADAQRDAFIR